MIVTRPKPLCSMHSRLYDSSTAGTILKENQTGFKTRHRLALVLLSLFAWLACVNVLTYSIIRFGIRSKHSDLKIEKKFNEDMESGVEAYRRIIKDTIPFAKEWYRVHHKESARRLSSPETEDACLAPFFTLLNEVAEFTSPDAIEGVLKSMGLSDLPVIRSFLKEYLESPQPIAAMYSRSSSCLQDSRHLSRMACAVAEKISLDGFASDQATARYIRDHIHRAVVLEVLTPALLDDVAALFQVQEVMRFDQYFAFRDFQSRKHRNDKNTLESTLAKYEGVMHSLEGLGQMIAANSAPIPGQHKRLQINILKAVKLDALRGFESNALVGIDLAATAKFDSVVKDQKVSWALGQDWVDSYSSWNLLFILGNVPVHAIQQLLIPSVSCNIGSEHGKDFMAARIVSLALFMMQSIDEPLPSSAINETSVLSSMESYYALTDSPPRLSQTAAGALLVNQLGEDLARHSVLNRPSADTVEHMLHDLCGGNCHDGSWKVTDTIPTSNLDHEQFQVYTGLFLWITCLLAGIGSELLVYILYLKQDGWTEENDRIWIMAQFFFPLLAATYLGLAISQNFMALPCLIAGLWKFGFPETLLYQHSALFGSGGCNARDLSRRISDFLKGSGTIAHHGGAAMLICMILAGPIIADDHVVSCILPLIAQHWFSLVHHVSRTLYIILELSLEAWFQWTIFSEFEHLLTNHWTVSLIALVMVTAHWQYVLAGGIDILLKLTAQVDVDDTSLLDNSLHDEDIENKDRQDEHNWQLSSMTPQQQKTV